MKLLKSKYLPSSGNLLFGGMQAMSTFAPLMFGALSNKKPSLDNFATSLDSIDKEKEEILQRAEWLSQKLITNPKELLETYPKILGSYYGPQWSIYSCVMFIAALSNIARIWPDQREKCLERIEKLLPLLLSEELRRYDTREWHEDALASLHGNKDHLTYLSLLAWSISLYRLAGGCNRYDQLFKDCCEALHRRMLRSKNLNLRSFPDKPFFSADFLVALVAFHNYTLVFNDSRFEATIDRWLSLSDTVWKNPKTGLLVSTLYTNRKGPVKGCYTGLNNFWLSLLDRPSFASDQYNRMKKHLAQIGKLSGIREYLYKSPKLAFDPNSGPVVEGMSPSGTAFAIGSATFHGDWQFRNEMLATAQKAGGDVHKKGMRHYKLGEFALVGEATVLAMRTNIKK